MNTNEFFNSKSMLTPGIAGAICMFFANSLGTTFGMENYMPHMVLVLSFIVGALVFADKGVQWYVKIILYVVNSLFIFSMATGSNTIGVNISRTEKKLDQTIELIDSLAISSIHSTHEIFIRTQLADSSLVRKKNLSNQIVSISTMIIAVQKQLVEKPDSYTNPEQKLNTLKGINESLILINRSVKNQNKISKDEQAIYQGNLLEVQHNLGVLQKAILIEENQKEKFFKPWFKN